MHTKLQLKSDDLKELMQRTVCEIIDCQVTNDNLICSKGIYLVTINAMYGD